MSEQDEVKEIAEFMETGKELVEQKIVEEAEEQQEKQKETKQYKDLDEFVNDPEQQKSARLLAKQVQELVGKNWFDMKRFSRKTRGATFGSVQLGLLIQFGLLVVKNEGKDQFYKIVFDTIDQQAMINDELESLKLREKILKAELRKLKKKQKELDKAQKEEG